MLEEFNKYVLDDLGHLKKLGEEHGKSLASIDKTLARQADQLEHHIKRTEIAEAQILKNSEAIKPLEKMRWSIIVLFKIGVALGGFISAAYGIIKIVEFFKKI